MRANHRHSKNVSLLITNDFPPIVSGISTVFYHVWKRLPSEKIMVLAPKAAGWRAFDKKEPFHVIRKKIPTGESGMAKVFKMAFNMVYALYYAKKYPIRKLHCGQILSAGPAGLVCKKFFGLPYSVYVYGSETIRFGNSRLTSGLMRKVIAEADELVANSECTRREYGRWGVPGGKIAKVVPGVDSDFFHPGEKPRYLIERYNLHGKRVILTVGRLDERKGHDVVIRATARLVRRIPGIVYLIVGKGREEHRLKSLVGSLNLDGHVIFAGFVPDEHLPDYYNLCDVFVLPNRETEAHGQLRGDYEGFGVVFLEAGACGKPAVAGDSGGSNEAVVDGVTGVITDPKSEDAIARAIERILTDNGLAGRMGMAGRQRAVKEFDWRHIAKAMEGLL